MGQPDREEREINRVVVRIQAWLLVRSFGVVCGAGLFLIIAWLLIRGGEQVGSRLQLLSN